MDYRHNRDLVFCRKNKLLGNIFPKICAGTVSSYVVLNDIPGIGAVRDYYSYLFIEPNRIRRLFIFLCMTQCDPERGGGKMISKR